MSDDGFRLGESGQAGRAPDFGPGDPRNHDDGGYVYRGRDNNTGGSSGGCMIALLIMAGGTITSALGAIQYLC